MRYVIAWRCIVALVYAVAASAHAAPWRSILVEDPAKVRLDADLQPMPALHSATDGALRAYPLLSPLASDLDGSSGFALVARFGAAGTIADLSAGSGTPTQLGTLTADGSLMTVSWNVSRIAADGGVAWSIPNPDNSGGGVIAHAGGNSLLLMNGRGRLQFRQLAFDDGRLLDAVESMQPSTSCVAQSAVGDGVGSWFVVIACEELRVVKLTGSPLRIDAAWQLPAAGSGARVASGHLYYDAGGLYASVTENGVTRLGKFSPLNGASLWTYPDASSGFSDGGLFYLKSGVLLGVGLQNGARLLQRLDPATGQPVWTRSEAFDGSKATVSADRIIVGGTEVSDSGSGAGQPRAFLQGIDLATGASQWRSSLTHPVGNTTFGDVASQGNQAVAIGRVCNLQPSDLRTCELSLWRVNGETGTLVESGALKARTGYRGIFVDSAMPGSQVQAALQMGEDGQQLRIRRLRETDGHVLFESIVPASLTAPWLVPDFVEVSVTAEGHYLAQLSKFYYGVPAYEADVVLMKIHGSTGALLWRRSLVDFATGAQNIYTNSPATDSAGNVLLSVSYEDDWRVRRTTLMKLAAVSGQTMWELPQPVVYGAMNPASSVLAISDDVLVSAAGGGWERRRGSDGGVIWSAGSLPVNSGVVDEGGIDGVGAVGGTLNFRRVDAATGSTLVSGSYSNAEDSAFDSAFSVRGADGDVYVAARRRTGTIYKAIVVKFSAATGAPLWANRLDAGTLAGSRWTPRFFADDVLYLSGRPSGASGSYLMALNANDGSLRGMQLLYANDSNHFDQLHESGVPLRLLADGSLMAAGGLEEPGQPVRSFVENRPSPVGATSGALRVAVATSDAAQGFSAGKSFTIDVINDGSTAAAGVRTVMGFGSDVTLDSVTCNLAGANCTASTSTSNGVLRVTTAIPAGATLRLTGRAGVPAGSDSPIKLSGSAIADYGFTEVDLTDNFVAETVLLHDLVYRATFE